jgi:hypothetical protein
VRYSKTLIISFLTLAMASASLSAQEFEHGHQAMQLFDKEGFENSPQWVQIWVGFMMASFMAGVLFVRNHVIARWVVGGVLAGLIFGAIAGAVFGVPNYSGFIALVHIIFWTPALYQLLTKRPFLGERSAFTVWSGGITLVICFSFIFDIRDAAIYLSHIL